jgi:hypothetical protein
MFAVFDDLERVMMLSEVFFNGNVAFLIDLLIVYPTVKKHFNLHKKFLEKTYFFFLITFQGHRNDQKEWRMVKEEKRSTVEQVYNYQNDRHGYENFRCLL